jgi:hypothetical protein
MFDSSRRPTRGDQDRSRLWPRITRKVERASPAIRGDPVVVAFDLRVFPGQEVALAPAVGDHSGDHGFQARLLDMDQRGNPFVGYASDNA